MRPSPCTSSSSTSEDTGAKRALNAVFQMLRKLCISAINKPMESHDSYLARADVLWSKLASQKLQMEDLQAYRKLRGASLTSDDKKRIILDSDQSLDGKLTISRVREAVRMLGTSFFQEMTGQGRKTVKTKVYDSNALLTEDQEPSGDMDDQVHQVQHEDFDEDEMIETLLAEGDNDAAFVADYEAAASELLQSDDETLHGIHVVCRSS